MEKLGLVAQACKPATGWLELLDGLRPGVLLPLILKGEFVGRGLGCTVMVQHYEKLQSNN